MRLLSITRLWMVPAAAAVLSPFSAGDAMAQNQQSYQTPLDSTQSQSYTASPPAELDKTYGLPTFGMKDAELPRQKTMAPEKKPDDRGETDLFSGATETQLPKTLQATPGRASMETPSTSDMETPLYTTSQGSTTGDTSTSPLYPDSTGDGTSFWQKPARGR